MREFLTQSTTRAGFVLTEAQKDSFIKYYEVLMDWNAKMNLTAITEPNDVVTKHFTDSLMGLKHIPKGASVVDVGSGAGFPGIPFKIVREDISILLLDSLKKRINFLNQVISDLELEKIQTLHTRAEDGAQSELRESFDVVTARAVANLSILSEYCLPYAKAGGLFFAFKGGDVSQEVQEAEKAIELLGGELMEVEEYQLPFSDIKHSLILIKKVRQTSVKYPRNSGKILKSPIK